MTRTKQNGMGEHSYGSKVKSRPLFLQRGYGNKEYVRYIPIQRGHGLGTLFRTFFKIAKPLISRGVKIAKPLISRGIKITKPYAKNIIDRTLDDSRKIVTDTITKSLKNRKNTKKNINQGVKKIIKTGGKRFAENWEQFIKQKK